MEISLLFHVEVTGHAYYTGTSVFTVGKRMTLLGKDFYSANFKLLTLMTKYCSCSKFLDKHFKNQDGLHVSMLRSILF